MKKILLTLCFLLIASNVYAARWIQCVSTTEGTVTYDKPSKREGDCLGLGLCTGLNNTGLLPGVFQAIGTEWNDAGQANKKCDLVGAEGDRIIDLTAQELSDIANANSTNAELSLRTGSKARFDGQTEEGLSNRCVLNLLRDELNILRTWTRDFKTEAASATSLNNFKSRIATLATLNDRSVGVAKSAVQGCIDNGDADE